MPTVYKGSAPGTGGFFKWDGNGTGRSPKLVLKNVILRADQLPNHGTLATPASLGYSVTCENVTVVWLGVGSFPNPDPCYTTITTSRGVWDNALAAWRAAHPAAWSGPDVTIGKSSVLEGGTNSRSLLFTVALSVPAPAPVSVYWTTQADTADQTDFVSRRGMLNFKAGDVWQRVTVPVLGDTTVESTETMHVLVVGVLGGWTRRGRSNIGDGTILNDDLGSGTRIGIGSASVIEGNAGNRRIGVPVTLSEPSSANVTVAWNTQTAGTATPAVDYSSDSGTITFPAGTVSQYIGIAVYPDTVHEGDETFQVALTNPSVGTITRGTATATILDDD